MAVKTYEIASFADGLVRTEIDVNDANLRVTTARIINNSDKSAVIDVYKAGVLAVSQVVSGGQTISKNLPASIKFAYDAGDPDWGIPPAIYMADISIFTRWPS